MPLFGVQKHRLPQKACSRPSSLIYSWIPGVLAQGILFRLIPCEALPETWLTEGFWVSIQSLLPQTPPPHAPLHPQGPGAALLCGCLQGVPCAMPWRAPSPPRLCSTPSPLSRLHPFPGGPPPVPAASAPSLLLLLAMAWALRVTVPGRPGAMSLPSVWGPGGYLEHLSLSLGQQEQLTSQSRP